MVFPDAHEVQPETGGCETREEHTLQSLRLQSKNGNIEEEVNGVSAQLQKVFTNFESLPTCAKATSCFKK